MRRIDMNAMSDRYYAGKSWECDIPTALCYLDSFHTLLMDLGEDLSAGRSPAGTLAAGMDMIGEINRNGAE